MRVLAAGLLCLVLASCGHFELVPTADVRAEEVVGYQVRVTMTDGRVLLFRVVDVTEDALVGEFQRARFEEVAALERREYGIGETAAAFMVFLGALAVLVGISYSRGAG